MINQAIQTEYGFKWRVHFNNTDEVNNAIYDGTAEPAPIAPGKTARVKYSGAIPATAAKGRYYLVACVDLDGSAGNMMTHNNFMVFKSKIRIK